MRNPFTAAFALIIGALLTSVAYAVPVGSTSFMAAALLIQDTRSGETVDGEPVRRQSGIGSLGIWQVQCPEGQEARRVRLRDRETGEQRTEVRCRRIRGQSNDGSDRSELNCPAGREPRQVTVIDRETGESRIQTRCRRTSPPAQNGAQDAGSGCPAGREMREVRVIDHATGQSRIEMRCRAIQSPAAALSEQADEMASSGMYFTRARIRGVVETQLPGHSGDQRLAYAVEGGMAIAEGDIIIGEVDASGRVQSYYQIPDGAFDARPQPGLTYQGVTGRDADAYYWSGGVIPYVFNDDVTASTRAVVGEAAVRLSRDTNLHIRPARDGDEHVVRISYHDGERGCFSTVGRSPLAGTFLSGRQSIRLLPNNGCSVGAIMHEFLHTAGFWHEQSRPDRNQYVTFIENNVLDGFEGNFDIHFDSLQYGTPYDYGSIMHYWSRSWGIPDAEDRPMLTLPPVNPDDPYDIMGRTCLWPWSGTPTNLQIMGQKRCLSTYDIQGVNARYTERTECYPGERLLRGQCVAVEPEELCEANEVRQRVRVRDNRGGAGSGSQFESYQCVPRYNGSTVCPAGQQSVRYRDPERPDERRYVRRCREVSLETWDLLRRANND